MSNAHGAATPTRQGSINPGQYAETIESLGFIKAIAATQRAGRWDAIKFLSGPEAEAMLKDMSDLQLALPAAMEEMRKRIQVSINQGQKSLKNKAAKKAEREAAAKAEQERAVVSDGAEKPETVAEATAHAEGDTAGTADEAAVPSRWLRAPKSPKGYTGSPSRCSSQPGRRRGLERARAVPFLVAPSGPAD